MKIIINGTLFYMKHSVQTAQFQKKHHFEKSFHKKR
jgi:hypothetical protein